MSRLTLTMLWWTLVTLCGSNTDTAAQLVSPTVERTLRQLLPQTDDPAVNKILKSPRLILYTRREMPLVYWQNGTFRDGRFDIGPSYAPRPHNGARGFPWNLPGGTHRSPNCKTFKFLFLPEGKRIAWRRERTVIYRSRRGRMLIPERGPAQITWTYPPGTIFGEILLVTRGREAYTFELRTRTKEGKEWGVDIFRPFPTAESLLKEIPLSSPVAQHLLTAGLQGGRLRQSRHIHAVSFDTRSSVDILPDFGDPQLVKKLLAKPFRSCLGENWRGDCVAPTTRAKFSIVPANYDGAYLGNDRVGCGKCHESTNVDVSKFHLGRDWYGRVRGMDRILSFSIADPQRLVRDARRAPVRFNPRLTGILERFDRGKHREYRNTNAPR